MSLPRLTLRRVQAAPLRQAIVPPPLPRCLFFSSSPSPSSSSSYTSAPTPSASSGSSDSPYPDSPIPIFTSIRDYRAWRRRVRRLALQSASDGASSAADCDALDAHDVDSVGFVPTMGALHAGHLDLVRASLRENAETVVSIFVNPAQFAPSEDLASYPRTLRDDVDKLHALWSSEVGADAGAGTGTGNAAGRIGAIFCPSVSEMYPPLPGTHTPFTQDTAKQQGAFVTVAGLSDVLEGASRPGFFRGVATVVTKLWHVVEPTRVYFGQKDIQQALVLRALLTSLLFQYPSPAPTRAETPPPFRVIPTGRDASTGLALSSRNAYLGTGGRKWAPTLYRVLSAARREFLQGGGGAESSSQAASRALAAARTQFDAAAAEAAAQDGVQLEWDYVSFNSSDTLRDLVAAEPSSDELQLHHSGSSTGTGADTPGAILSGAMWVVEPGQGEGGKDRRTRLIDNLLIGRAEELLAQGGQVT